MEEEAPYIGEKFYAVNDDGQMQFQFSNSQGYDNEVKVKRPQSANIRVSKDKLRNRNKFYKQNKNKYEANNSGEDVNAAISAPDVRAIVAGSAAYREQVLSNNSQFNRSPPKIQK